MQAVLILGARKVLAPEVMHRPVVPPQITTAHGIEEVRDDNLRPNRLAKRIRRRHARQPLLRLRSLVHKRDVDGNEDGTAENAQNDKDVPTHPREAQEDGGVDAHVAHHLGLGRLPQRRDPRPQLLAYRGRRVLLVGVLEARGVDGLVVGSEQGEEDRDDGGEAERGAEGEPYRRLLELRSGG